MLASVGKGGYAHTPAEHASEMVGISKSQFLGYLTHAHLRASQQGLRSRYYLALDVILSSNVQFAPHKLSEVIRSKVKLLSAPCHGGLTC